MKTIERLKGRAKKSPNAPGVYFWLDKNGRPLYIGRAGSLKKRLASYFLAKADTRIAEMVSVAKFVKWQKTATLLEAIVLEANLIKKFWPKYNVKDKDDKSFIYLVINTKEDYPRPIVIRGRELERYKKIKAKVFGPYQSWRTLRTALELLRPIFPYSNCKTPLLLPGSAEPGSKSGRPCFYYQIGLCPGVCIGRANKSEYRKNIKNLILFFKGEKSRLLKKLKKENPNAAKALQHIRDVALLAESDLAVQGSARLSSQRIEGYDISHLAGKEPVGAMVVFENGEPDPSQYRLFKIRGVNSADMPKHSRAKGARNYDDLAMLREVIERRLGHPEWPLPDVFLVDGGLLQVKAVRDALGQKKIFSPVVGLAKSGRHAASAHAEDKLVALNVKSMGKEVISTSKRLFQQVRNEAHRFCLRASRAQGRRRLGIKNTSAKN